MTIRRTITGLAAAAALAGCASQSRFAQPPIGIGTGINELQQSQCACGGVERKRDFQRRRRAELRAELRAQRIGEGGR